MVRDIVKIHELHITGMFPDVKFPELYYGIEQNERIH